MLMADVVLTFKNLTPPNLPLTGEEPFAPPLLRGGWEGFRIEKNQL